MAMISNYEEAPELARYAESLGFSGAWFSDSPSFRDPYAMMAVSALATKKISLAVGVANPYTRHPIVTARAIATIDEVSRGRAILCMATGDIVEILRPMGYSIKTPYAVVGEAVELIKAYLSNQEVNFHGQFFKVARMRLGFKPIRDVPIFIAGGGPRVMEVAGRVGDGVLINFFNDKLIEKCTERIKKGALSVHRDYSKLKLNCFGPMILVQNDVERREVLTDLKAFIALNMLLTPEEWLEAAGVKRSVIDAIKKNYVVGAHRDLDLEQQIIKKIGGFISEDVMDLFCLVGDKRYMIERLGAMSRAGIGNIVIWMKGKEISEKKQVLKRIGESIIPSFGGEGEDAAK